CKNNLHGRLIISKGDNPLTAKDLEAKILQEEGLVCWCMGSQTRDSTLIQMIPRFQYPVAGVMSCSGLVSYHGLASGVLAT
ncbi:hypothetical protein A2U01_0024136, partial [Trifolium medium]|nr:hypothetical protein [Trifolium medium]